MKAKISSPLRWCVWVQINE